jgi:hypothetical protein
MKHCSQSLTSAIAAISLIAVSAALSACVGTTESDSDTHPTPAGMARVTARLVGESGEQFDSASTSTLPTLGLLIEESAFANRDFYQPTKIECGSTWTWEIEDYFQQYQLTFAHDDWFTNAMVTEQYGVQWSPTFCQVDYPAGSPLVIHAIPGPGMIFSHWKNCPEVKSGNPQACQLTAEADVQLEAHFMKDPKQVAH